MSSLGTKQQGSELRYDPNTIEPRWQEMWEVKKLFQNVASDESVDRDNKEYLLFAFAYPSGSGLHVGHVESKTALDILARYHRMKGKKVFFPVGWDAFGLPAENYAIKTGVHPTKTTREAIKTFRRQIQRVGISYDWAGEIATSNPEYYRWTQWLFLQLYNKDLAYKKAALVNWCPSCVTVLANEQVVDGKCERCGHEVVQKDLEQWFFKITKYRDELLSGLSTVDWPEATRGQQINWIGKKDGTSIRYPFDTEANFVLLHGYCGSPDSGFFPWLKKQLEDLGHKVQIPVLPHPDQPTEDEQVEYVLKNCTFNEKTILFGHSLGTVVAMKVAERLETKITGLVLAGAFAEPKFKDHERSFSTTFSWEFDVEKIKKNVGIVSVWHDVHDRAVPDAQAEKVAEMFSVPVIRVQAEEPHFDADVEPEILDAVLPSIETFTTRPDTNFGASFVVIAPEHPLVDEIIKYSSDDKLVKEIEDYVVRAKNKTEIERQSEGRRKTGVFTGRYVVNRLNGEKLPVWISDFVLAGFGTGAVVGVPGHDKRDFEFAKEMNLPVRRVVEKEGGKSESEEDEEVFEGYGVAVESEFLNGVKSKEAITKVTQYLEERGWGRKVQTFKLRDWLISRQRYWGAPIPIVYDPEGKAHTVPEEHLPWELPTDVDFEPKGESPLKSSEELHARVEKIFGKGWKPEYDTMDTFVDSSWYFLRYVDPRNKDVFASKERMERWLPVDFYMIGPEHIVLHLLYARFFTKFLRDEGYLDFDEPFLKMRHQGMILGPDHRKMSKSRGNVIDPDEVIQQYGADTLRMYEMFLGPIDADKPWSTDSVSGVYRFLTRVYKICGEVIESDVQDQETDERLRLKLNQIVQKVGDDIPSLKFNTSIAAMMEFVNLWETVSKGKGLPQEGKGRVLSHADLLSFVKLIAPFAPFLAEDLYQRMLERAMVSEHDRFESVHLSNWPDFEKSMLLGDEVTIVVQVNGKRRAELLIESEKVEDEEHVKDEARKLVGKYVDDRKVRNVIYVSGKIVNFVV